jgi:hypothetical protein
MRQPEIAQLAALRASERIAECDRIVLESIWALSGRGILASQRWTCAVLVVLNGLLAAFFWSGQKSHANLWMGLGFAVVGVFSWRVHLRHRKETRGQNVAV